jgi:hypothetical protein
MKATFADGTLFEGTTDEFLAIRFHSPAAGNGHKAVAEQINATDWTQRTARAFWDSLDRRHGGGQQKKLLVFLLKNNGHATEDEVWKHLNIEKGQKLAGVLANLTRNARRETDQKVRAVHWRHDAKGVCSYYVPEDLLQFLKQIM